MGSTNGASCITTTPRKNNTAETASYSTRLTDKRSAIPKGETLPATCPSTESTEPGKAATRNKTATEDVTITENNGLHRRSWHRAGARSIGAARARYDTAAARPGSRDTEYSE